MTTYPLTFGRTVATLTLPQYRRFSHLAAQRGFTLTAGDDAADGERVRVVACDYVTAQRCVMAMPELWPFI